MNNQWFESRNLRVLTYQSEAIAKVQESLEQREITVLAACPSAGKTLMTIYMMEEWLRQNPNSKIMVLAHGTTILRTQFHDVLKETRPNFTYNLVEKFTQYDVTADVNICLPQTLAGNVLDKIDLLIVDEAHQFYFAEKMMKEIIKQTKPKKQLLLTGTPSPFIRKGFKIIPVTLNTIFDEGMISDLFVEIATSSYTFDPMIDFNQDDELKLGVYIKESETKKTLDDLVDKIVERLKSIRGNDYQNLLPEWLPTLKRLQKTMIACRSQHQAMQVKHYFDKIGVKSALSISDIDYNSSEIEVFKKDQDCLILIVVGRGILGFNYPELVNVVDMTTSQNVDRIYQLLCRVIRKHPEGQKKLFFKVAPNIHSDYYKYIMTAVLSLSDESFFTKFNGKNFSDMIIPVIKTKRDHHEPNNNGGSVKPRPKTLKPIDFEGLPVFEFFKDLYHKKDALLHVYAYTTVRDVRGEFLNRTFWTKDKCLEDALNYDTKRDWAKHSPNAYDASRKNGWYRDCTKHMTNIIYFWTKDECIASALKYEVISDWYKNEPKQYRAATHNNWLEDCTKHMTQIHNEWTKEMCLESALKHNTKGEWAKEDNKAYTAAQRNGWFDECISHMEIVRIVWNKEMCLTEALKYNTITEWQKNGNGYAPAKKLNCFEECIKHMDTLRNVWTKELCLESALKYGTISEWDKNDRRALQSARNNKWMNECTSHMKKLNLEWTKELCLESALKYETIAEWDKNDRKAYSAACRNNWLTECTMHMREIIKPSGYWTKENCILEAQKYNTLKEFRTNSSGAHSAAKNNGWFDDCVKNMKRLTRIAWTKEECIESALKYNTKSEWMKNENSAYNASKNLNCFEVNETNPFNQM
jgi:superfamily II DNA or RNA helicase